MIFRISLHKVCIVFFLKHGNSRDLSKDKRKGKNKSVCILFCVGDFIRKFIILRFLLKYTNF